MLKNQSLRCGWAIAAALWASSGATSADTATGNDRDENPNPAGHVSVRQQREALIAKCLSDPMHNPIRCEQDAIILFGRGAADGSAGKAGKK